MGPNPNLVGPLATETMNDAKIGGRCVTQTVSRNRFRVATADRLGLGDAPVTQGSRVRQPWAVRSNPSELLRKLEACATSTFHPAINQLS
jgi:hypothetical protein